MTQTFEYLTTTAEIRVNDEIKLTGKDAIDFFYKIVECKDEMNFSIVDHTDFDCSMEYNRNERYIYLCSDDLKIECLGFTHQVVFFIERYTIQDLKG